MKEGCVSYTRRTRDKLGLQGRALCHATHYHFLAVCAWASSINLSESCFLHRKGKGYYDALLPRAGRGRVDVSSGWPWHTFDSLCFLCEVMEDHLSLEVIRGHLSALWNTRTSEGVCIRQRGSMDAGQS